MKNFNRGSKSDRGHGFNRKGGNDGNRGNRGFGDRDSSRSTTMYPAVCSNCGKDCEVPFKPTGDRPVFCSDCFKKSRGEETSRSGGRDSQRGSFSDRGSFGDKRMYQAKCANCGKDCEVPFKPTGERPVYCSDCFSKSGKADVKKPDNSSRQFELLNAKLDNILALLSPAKPSKKEKVLVKKTVVVKKAKAKKKSK